MFVVAFLTPESYLTALGQMVGSIGAALVGAFVLRRIAKFENSLYRLRDALALIFLGAFGSAMVSASIGTVALHASHISSYAGLGSAWLIYWLGDSTGVLLVTPLVLTFPDLLRIRTLSRLAEFICLLTILVAVSAVVFGDLAIVPVRMIAFAVLPIVIWAAIRFGVGGAALSIFLVATVATVETAFGSGSFAGGTPFINGVQLDVFFALLSLTGLTFASVYAEREQAQGEREQSLREQVSMEVRLEDQQFLRASEERLRLAQQAARMGTFEWDIQTGVNTWNREMEALYGLPPGGFGGTRAAFENLILPDDRAAVMALFNWALETGQPTTGEWRAAWPDGSVHWIAGHWQVFRDHSGKAVRVVGVNVDITQRKRIEQMLREYERAVEGSGDMIAIVDREYRCLMANRQYLELKNLTRDQVVGRFVYEFVDEKLFRDVIKAKLDDCFRGKVVKDELKYTYPKVGERVLFISYFPIESPQGIDRVTCLLQDITERKKMEQTLREMTRRLIEAQEQERARIGRELHDDINQRLALLAAELDQLPVNPPELRSRMEALRNDLSQISEDVQGLSHDLSFSKLEYLGTVAAIRSWSKEFAERQKIEVDFRSDVHSSLPLNLGLPLFRVLQEALHNASKHSGVQRVEVQLREDPGEIHLLVSDSGAGFDVDSAFHGKGLGLSSMRERVRLVNGTIAIESKPGAGTKLEVRIPLQQERRIFGRTA